AAKVRATVLAALEDGDNDLPMALRHTLAEQLERIAGLEREMAAIEDRLQECNDPALPAQVRPLKHKPRRGSSCPAPGAGAGGCRTGSSRRLLAARAAGTRSGGGVRIVPSRCG